MPDEELLEDELDEELEEDELELDDDEELELLLELLELLDDELELLELLLDEGVPPAPPQPTRVWLRAKTKSPGSIFAAGPNFTINIFFTQIKTIFTRHAGLRLICLIKSEELNIPYSAGQKRFVVDKNQQWK